MKSQTQTLKYKATCGAEVTIELKKIFERPYYGYLISIDQMDGVSFASTKKEKDLNSSFVKFYVGKDALVLVKKILEDLEKENE